MEWCDCATCRKKNAWQELRGNRLDSCARLIREHPQAEEIANARKNGVGFGKY